MTTEPTTPAPGGPRCGCCGSLVEFEYETDDCGICCGSGDPIGICPGCNNRGWEEREVRYCDTGACPKCDDEESDHVDY